MARLIVDPNSLELKQILPNVPISDTKQCKNCNKFYNSKLEANERCNYHPGRYAISTYATKLGGGDRVSSWTCCKAALEEQGCKFANGHVPSKSTEDALHVFDQLVAAHGQTATPKPNTSSRTPGDISTVLPGVSSFEIPPELLSNDDILGKREKSKTKLPMFNEKQGFITHSVALSETLSILSLRYNVSVARIRDANKPTVIPHDLRGLIELKIPKGMTSSSMLDEQRLKLRKKMIIHFQRSEKVGEGEAVYYLETCDFDHDKAVAMRRDDMSIEKK